MINILGFILYGPFHKDLSIPKCALLSTNELDPQSIREGHHYKHMGTTKPKALGCVNV